MTITALKQRVQARDRLLQQAEQVGQQLNAQLLLALARGELTAAEAAARSHDAQLHELTENLRIYQAELHAQADELATSQARSDELLSRFSTLFANMPVAALLVAANGEVLEHNAVAAQLMGLRQRVSAARFVHRLVDSDSFQRLVRPAFLEAQASGHGLAHDVQFVGEGGSRFIGELHIAKLRSEQAVDGAFACAVVDRTEHLEDLHALEQALEVQRQNEAFLSDTALLARTGGWELTLRPRGMRWSQQLLELLGPGTTRSATLEHLLARCAPYDRGALASAVAAAELGTGFELEVDMQGGPGQDEWLRVLAVGRPEWVAGRVARVHGVLQDVSRQHQMRRQMSDLTDRLAIANNAGGIGVWDCDLRHNTLVFDHRMAQLFGLPQPLQQAGSLHATLQPRLSAEHAHLLQQALEATVQRLEPLNLELHLGQNHGNGDLSWVHITGRAHPDAEGRAVRLVGCAWDSSPQHEALRLKAAHDAAETASRAKSAFLSRMSHELRTPLNAILGFSQLMRLEAEAGDLVLKPHRVTLIESAARHLLDLVNEVLDVSRIEAGQMDIQLKRCDLYKIVQESLPMVQGQADTAGVEVRERLHDDPNDRAPLWVHGDRLRLKELVINLLSNAVKFNRSGGRVTITAQPFASGLELHVADTGRGLTEQQLQNLFQPFNRLGAEALGIQGSGMGLFVCRRFVELMGGELRVHSQLEVGTTVVARLKLPPPEPAQELPEAVAAQGPETLAPSTALLQATRQTFNMLVPPG